MALKDLGFGAEKGVIDHERNHFGRRQRDPALPIDLSHIEAAFAGL